MKRYSAGSKLLVLFILFVFPLSIFSALPAFTKWKLRISVEKAVIHQSPDWESSVVTTQSMGALIEAYEKEGEWFRVVIGPDEEGILTIGYLHSGDVEILEEKIPKETDFWPEERENFQGIGMKIRIDAEYNFISPEDFEKGLQGMIDSATDLLLAQGDQVEPNPEHLRSVIGFTGDVIYTLSPKLGIGLGFGYLSGQRGGTASFNKEGFSDTREVNSDTMVSAVFPRAGIFLTFPFHRLFSLTLNGGGALYFAKYTHLLMTPNEIDNISQSAKAKSLGFHGGIGLEIKLTNRAALLIETQGRYAKIGGFEGKASSARLEYQMWAKSEQEGKLYYVETDTHPILVVSRENPSGYRNVREARFDLSGLSIRVGLLVKF